MGWQSDWLYQLVFDQVKKVWDRAIRDGAGRFGPPPNSLLISQMSDADWEQVRCRGDIRRQWTYQGSEPEPLTRAAGDDTDLGERRGMFYERGAVAFCIDSDRKRVLFTFTLGPRYGRGLIFGVVGQGAKGRLGPSPGPMWVS